MWELLERPTPLPEEMSDWLLIFANVLLTKVPEAERRPMLDEVSEALRPDLADAEGRWQADYVRLRFRAVKPA